MAPDEFLQARNGCRKRAWKNTGSLVYGMDGFAEYFFAATPIAEIAELNIGSRPVSRKATQRIEDLRAFLGAFHGGNREPGYRDGSVLEQR